MDPLVGTCYSDILACNMHTVAGIGMMYGGPGPCSGADSRPDPSSIDQSAHPQKSKLTPTPENERAHDKLHRKT